MNNLHAFLHPVQEGEAREIVLSRRFTDGNGTPVPFRIRALTQEENDLLASQSMDLVKGGRRGEKALNEITYGRRLIVAATVEPDFTNAELCAAYGVMDPLELPGKMLLAGEYNRLSKAILELSGFSSSAEELEEQAKN